MKRRTTVLAICALMSLGAAGLAAAHGRPPGPHGKPSTTPPPGGHGHHHHDHGHHKGPGHGNQG